MKFLVDSCMSKFAVEALRQNNYDTIRLVNIRATEHGEKILRVIEKYGHEFARFPLITVERTRIRIKYPDESNE